MPVRKTDAVDDVLSSVEDWVRDLKKGATWEVLLEPWVVPIAVDALGGLAPLVSARTDEEFEEIGGMLTEHVKKASKDQVVAYVNFLAATEAWPEIEDEEPEPTRRRGRR